MIPLIWGLPVRFQTIPANFAKSGDAGLIAIRSKRITHAIAPIAKTMLIKARTRDAFKAAILALMAPTLTLPLTLALTLTLTLTLALALVPVAHALPAKAQGAVRILAFGDSLSAGYQLPQGAGFTDQLEKSLKRAGLNVEVINAAVSGDTTSSGLNRLDWSTPDHVDLVILELGANDALQGLPPERAKTNLSIMIERFMAKGITVLLAGMQAPPNMGSDYVDRFNAIYPALAEQYGTPLYPFFLDGVAANPDLNLDDGMHPNEKGIAEIVKRIAPLVIRIVKKAQ
jgi:acyl-CoA thioesterase I